jgi:hypothetical protein
MMLMSLQDFIAQLQDDNDSYWDWKLCETSQIGVTKLPTEHKKYSFQLASKK